MSSGVACCQANLRAWISVVVIVQCALILLYWDVTRNQSPQSPQSPQSQPLQFQSWPGDGGDGGGDRTGARDEDVVRNANNDAPPGVKEGNHKNSHNEATGMKDAGPPKQVQEDAGNINTAESGVLRMAPSGGQKLQNSRDSSPNKNNATRQENHYADTNALQQPNQRQIKVSDNANKPPNLLQSKRLIDGWLVSYRPLSSIKPTNKVHVLRTSQHQNITFDRGRETAHPGLSPKLGMPGVKGNITWRSDLGPHVHSPIDLNEKVNFTDPYSVNASSQIFNMEPIETFLQRFPTLPAVFQLKPGDDVFSRYFIKNGASLCFTGGTAHASDAAGKMSYDGCLCEKGWHGRYCSIPESVYFSTGSRFVEGLKPRNVSRRVISAMAFNMEFELLEARLHELHDVVDVFIILESNYTNYGESKPLRLLQRLRDGYLKEFHSKILYLFWGRFPSGGREDGWIVDQYMRMFIGQAGMRRISNSRLDDIFLYTDADELPSREAILFLRMHDGYSEPFGISLRWSVFGFFWRQLDATRVMIGCTVGMFRYVFKNDGYQLRSGDYQAQSNRMLHAYIRSGAFVYEWHLGDNSAFAGWHCSWCLPPVRVRTKLTSAINADFPRWGDFPQKLQLSYLRHLIKSGTWFDDKTRFGRLVTMSEEPTFAPKYLLDNYSKFKYLLDLEAA